MEFSDIVPWQDITLPVGDVPETRTTIFAFADGVRHDSGGFES